MHDAVLANIKGLTIIIQLTNNFPAWRFRVFPSKTILRIITLHDFPTGPIATRYHAHSLPFSQVTKQKKPDYLLGIPAISHEIRGFPSLPYDRFGFFLEYKMTKTPDGMNYPPEALNKFFKFTPSHGETPKRGYD